MYLNSGVLIVVTAGYGVHITLFEVENIILSLPARNTAPARVNESAARQKITG